MAHDSPALPAGLAMRRVALDTLHLDPANAREHGPENMEAIVGSLKRFGQAEPLVVQKSLRPRTLRDAPTRRGGHGL